MKTSKKFLSIFLALIMIFSIIPMSTITASATSRSPDEAIAWCRSQLGKALDYDGVHGAQCVDFIAFYYQYLGVTTPGGNGVDYAYNALPNGWTRVQGGTPQKGDILVYSGNSANPNGHVAIYESEYSTYHQNVGGAFVKQFTNVKYNGFDNPYWGYIRPNWGLGGSSSTVAPDVPNISIDKYVVQSNETFNIHFYAQNAERYWIGFYLNNVLVYSTETIYQEVSVSLPSEGKYSVVVSAINSIGEKAGYTSIVVGDATEYLPTVPQISVNKKILELNETLIVNFYSEKVEEYWIGFYYEDVLVHSCTPGSTEYQISFDKLGKYSVVISSINKFGETFASLKFVVGKYDVVFESNCGTELDLKQTKAHNTDLVLTSTVPSREGYTFLGWSTDKNATMPEYLAGSVYSENKDITLYAVWQKNPVTVSSISIATKPIKTEYYVDDTFNSSGLSIKITMSDGTTQTLTSGFTVSNPDMSTAGTKTVTVTYSGKMVTFTINVIEKPVTPNIPDSNYTFSIKNPSRTEIRNKDGIILHANVEGNAPADSYVRWESNNGNFDKSADGSNLKIIAKNKGWTTFTAILCDADGNELARDTVDMYSKSGFFDKIGGFFRSLFGTTKIYEN